jgi:hypothetical protein
MIAVCATSGKWRIASSKSQVKVAMPQRRGSALPTKAMRKPSVTDLS